MVASYVVIHVYHDKRLNNLTTSETLDEKEKSKDSKTDAYNFAWIYFEEYCKTDVRFKSNENSLIEYLNEYKSYPFCAEFSHKNKTWNIFITNGLRSYNITVNKELSKGTIEINNIIDGSTLYSPEEFKDIIHDQFSEK